MSWDWLTVHWSGILGDVGIIAGLLFSGVGFWRDARVRRAQTLLEVTKLHRELWTRYEERPELAGLFDKSRDLVARPLTSEEVRFANFLFLHLRATFDAEKSGIYVWPEHVTEDWREILAHPATSAAWARVKHLHDREFIAFVEGFLAD